MKTASIILFILLIVNTVKAQSKKILSFKNAKETVSKSKDKDNLYAYSIISNIIKTNETEKYTFKVIVDTASSSLPSTDYSIDNANANIDDLNRGHKFYLIIKKDVDTLPDRERKLFLNLKVYSNSKEISISNNDSAILRLQINVAPVKNDALKSYSYLAYIGTNFDLVEGIKAKNLFFATNIYSAPMSAKGKKIGFNILMYGNRAITSTISGDSSTRSTFTNRVVRRGDSVTYYRESGVRNISRMTDNLGASFNFLFKVGNLSNDDNSVQFYYAPQIEFIWRRTTLTTEYTNISPEDSTVIYNRPITGTIILTPHKTITPINIYDVYLGFAAINLRHENENISVRVQTALGYNISYISTPTSNNQNVINEFYNRRGNFYLSARAWITEPSSGITFGAEVSNMMFKEYRPYYNVTLSKAINLKSLSTIFNPIVTR